MNPQEPQQPYGQPAYVPPAPGQSPQPSQIGGSGVTAATTPSPSHSAGGQSPYDFILNPEPPAKNSPLGGGSILKRLLAIVGILLVLSIIGVFAANFLIPKDTSGAQIVAIAQEQQELARVASVIAQGANSGELKDFATTTQMSIETNRQASMQYITERKIEVDDEMLALKQDAETDASLKAAKSTNTFDRVAAQTLNGQLVEYQANLKKAYDVTTGEKARKILQASYDTASALVAQGAPLSN